MPHWLAIGASGLTMSTSIASDVVVAGGGHNGLVAAAYLALAGLEVAVLEARDVVGGGAVTEELTLPGFRHDTFSTGHMGLLGNPLIAQRELPLHRYGLRYLAPDPVVTLPLAGDDRSIVLWRDAARTGAEFARFSSRDGDAWLDLMDDWRIMAPAMREVLGRAPTTGSATLRQWAGQAFRGVFAALQGRTANAMRLRSMLGRSALEEICARFESEAVRDLMVWLVTITGQPFDQPATGALAVVLPALLAENGWAHPVGGAGEFPRALADLVRDHGGRIFTGDAVDRYLVEGGRAVGCRTRKGREYRAARAVLTSLHFTQLPHLAPDVVLPSAYQQGIDRWRGGASLFVVHLAVKRNPLVRAGPHRLGSVLCGSVGMDGLRRQLAELECGRASWSQDLWLLAACSTFIDPGRAPDGKGTVKMMTLAPYALDGDPANWASIRERYADHLVSLYRRLVADLPESDVLARTVMTPADIPAINSNFFGGNSQGGHSLPGQALASRPVPGWADYTTPIPGLYQTGCCTHPGGAVTGWPGRNAARRVLRDLGLDAP